MKHVINNSPLQEIKRLSPSDLSFDASLVRIKRTNTHDLIFFEDFDKLSSNQLTKVILEYNLDPDRLGVIIDEVKVLNNPHILSKTKKVINPSKIYIRPVDDTRYTKMIEEGINHFIEFGDWNKFDRYFLEDSDFKNIEATGLKIGQKLSLGAKEEARKEWREVKNEFKSDVSNFGKKAVTFAGGLYAVNKILNDITKRYAENDAIKPENQRSKLIATLRVLKGKLPRYESELSRTYDYKRKSILGKIIYKIKSAIRFILQKLGLKRKSYEDMQVNSR